MAELLVIGSGNAFGDGVKLQTCFWLEWNGKNILIDCGATSSFGIKKAKKNISDLDVIFITHLHGDHIGGLPFLLMELAYVSKNLDRRIEIFGPKDIEKRLFELQESMYPGSSEYLKPIIDCKEYPNESSWSDFKISVFPMSHAESSNPNGIRLEFDSKVFSFTGDGDWSDSHLKLAENADLFICECYDYDHSTPGHLSYKTLKNRLKDLSSKKLFLTHLGPDLLNNAKNVELRILEDGFRCSF